MNRLVCVFILIEEKKERKERKKRKERHVDHTESPSTDHY